MSFPGSHEEGPRASFRFHIVLHCMSFPLLRNIRPRTQQPETTHTRYLPVLRARGLRRVSWVSAQGPRVTPPPDLL